MENLKSIVLKIILPIVAVIAIGLGALFVLDKEETKTPNENNTNIEENQKENIVEDKDEITEEKDENESEEEKENEEVVSDDTITVIGGNNGYWKPTYGNGNTSNNTNNNSNKNEETNKDESDDKVEDTNKEDETNKDQSDDKVEDTDKEDETDKDDSDDKVEDTDKEDETDKDDSDDKVEDTDKEDGTDKDDSDDKDEEIVYVEPTAEFSVNGITSAKEAKTKITASGDYTKVEYGISTTEKFEDVEEWTEYVEDTEISIPNDKGNVYVIVRLTYTKDNSYVYEVSEVYEMLAWEIPTVEFSVNGITSAKEAKTKIIASGDYTKVEYGISTTEKFEDVEEWSEYVEDTEISIPNDKGNVYVIVRLTYTKDNSYVYEVSEVYEMLAWEAPVATFTLDGNSTAATSHVTSINVTGDYASIQCSISTSSNEADVITWVEYTNNTNINIYSTDGSDLYVIVKIEDKNGNVSYKSSNAFKMSVESLIGITRLVQTGGYDIVNDVDTVTYTFDIENNLTPNVVSVDYTFWTDDVSLAQVNGSYDMNSSTIEVKDIEDTGNVSKVYLRFTLTFDNGNTSYVTYEKDV